MKGGSIIVDRILITGSSGLIGRILMARLLCDYELFGLDLYVKQENDHLFRADVSNYGQVEEVINCIPDIHYVIHLAADPNHETDWQSALLNNIHGTKNVYEALRCKGGVKRVIFASSNHVTGYYEGVPPSLCDETDPEIITVDHRPRPDGSYGISKLTGEAIARYYFDHHCIESVCLRIGSVNEYPGKPKDDRHLCTWLSHDDLEHLIRRSLIAKGQFPGFGIYYGVSNNSRRFWDITNANSELGYVPKDKASDHWKKKDSSV